MIVVVDDIRFFPGVEVDRYIRTLDEALEWWGWYSTGDPGPIELWLDHDLGGLDTTRPLVRAIEDHLAVVGPLPIAVRIISDNPAGIQYIRQALEGRLAVATNGTPAWRIADGIVI